MRKKKRTEFLAMLVFMSVTHFAMHMFMLTPTFRSFIENSNRTHTYM